MDLQDQIINNMSNEISAEIDAEIMRLMLKDCGWYEVVLSEIYRTEKNIIESWTTENIKDSFWTYGSIWLFKDAKDRNWFAMRWI